MGFLLDNCRFFSHTDEMLKFSCGDKDLDDFFLNDAAKYQRQLLSKAYSFRLKSDDSVIVCAFTLSNSSVDARSLPNNRRRKLTENIPYEKSLSSYPATLIGRFGVSKDFGGKGIGTELMGFIKKRMLLPSYLTVCRFLTVDAYNNETIMKFYEKNGFKCIFSTDKQEKEHIGLPPEKDLRTRLMYFDLLPLT